MEEEGIKREKGSIPSHFKGVRKYCLTDINKRSISGPRGGLAW